MRKSENQEENGNAEYRYRFPCTQCDKRYTRKGHLKQHMQLHTGIFSHYCQICRRSFNSGKNFKEHMRRHEGLKHQCNYCSKLFDTKDGYQNHLSIHTGQFKFSCDKCRKGFNIRSLYLKHTQTHINGNVHWCVYRHGNNIYNRNDR